MRQITFSSNSVFVLMLCGVVWEWLLAASAIATPLLQAQDTAKRPNIILIMADDMGYECVGANGGETYQTPNLDRLAAGGMRFEQCYSQPICTPSRVKIMTGIANSRNYEKFGLLPSESFTFGNLLQSAGYKTCVVGKWQLQGGFAGPHRFGFDEYCLWQLTRRPNRYPNPGLEINGEEQDFKNGEYGPDLVSDYACDFIRRQASAEDPFFVYYPMILPHWPFEPTPDSEEWNPQARVNDKTEKGANKTSKKFFIDMVHYVDKIVGKIVAQLEQSGVRDETLILFTGDNGTYESIVSRFQGREWRGGKSYMSDNGTRTTLIANWPQGVAAGKVNTDLLDFSDILPTLADVAGANVPEHVALTGRSFSPQLKGEAGQPRAWVYCWYFRNGKPADGGKKHSAGEFARTHQYKLYRTGQFYDVLADFYEQSPLDPEQLTADQQLIRRQLQQVIEQHTRSGFYDSSADANE